MESFVAFLYPMPVIYLGIILTNFQVGFQLWRSDRHLACGQGLSIFNLWWYIQVKRPITVLHKSSCDFQWHLSGGVVWGKQKQHGLNSTSFLTLLYFVSTTKFGNTCIPPVKRQLCHEYLLNRFTSRWTEC